MTIAKGRSWGEQGPLPDDGVVVRDDAEGAAIVARARQEGRPPPALGLLGGDLCRTLGGRGDLERLQSPAAARAVVDVLVVELDGGPPELALAHLTACWSWWLGPVVAVMNAAWLGEWYLGPRAHPNDGLIDVVRADLPVGQRWAARRRLATGTHVPHPAIREQRTPRLELDLGRPMPVRLDGRRRGRARRISVTVEPDAVTVVV